MHHIVYQRIIQSPLSEPAPFEGVDGSARLGDPEWGRLGLAPSTSRIAHPLPQHVHPARPESNACSANELQRPRPHRVRNQISPHAYLSGVQQMHCTRPYDLARTADFDPAALPGARPRAAAEPSKSRPAISVNRVPTALVITQAGGVIADEPLTRCRAS